jgi:hypothetical protein
LPLPLTLILTLLALLITSLGIGGAVLHLLRTKLNLHPAESLCLAIALSWLVVFQIAFAAFAAGSFAIAPIPIFLLSLLGLALARPLLLRWLKYPFTRAMLAGFLLLLAWHLLNHAGNIIYAWGFWYGDWFEHYERMLLFSFQGPVDTTFLEGIYTFPARPPMQNVCQAYVNSLCATPLPQTFPGFQLSSTFFSTLLALPVFLLTRRMAQRSSDPLSLRERAGVRVSASALTPSPSFRSHSPRVSIWVAAVILAASWPFLVNAIFTWTKSFTAFYVLLAVCLYLRPPSRTRDLLVFLAFGAGILVHYSAALVMLPFLLWYLGAYLRHPSKLPAAIAAGIPGALLLVPWVLFVQLSMPGSLLSSTSSSQLAQGAGIPQVGLWALQHAIGALVPFYGGPSWSQVTQNISNTSIENLRALFFMLTQHIWIFCIGFTGILILAIESTRSLLRKKLPPNTGFWVFMILATAFTTGLSLPKPPEWGFAHVALPPFIVMTAAWIAGAWPTFSLNTRRAFLLLTLLQFIIILIDASVFTSTPLLPDIPLPAFDSPMPPGQPLPGFDPSHTYLIHPAGLANLILKHKYNLHFLADSFGPHLRTLFYAITLFSLAWLTLLARQINHPSSLIPSPSGRGLE